MKPTHCYLKKGIKQLRLKYTGLYRHRFWIAQTKKWRQGINDCFEINSMFRTAGKARQVSFSACKEIHSALKAAN